MKTKIFQITPTRTSTSTPVAAKSCRILESKTVFPCGITMKFAPGGFLVEYLRPHLLSRDECDIAVRTGKFRFKGRNFRTEITGLQEQARYFSQGSITSDGQCLPPESSFDAGNATFRNHVEETHLYIEFKSIQGVRDLQHDLALFGELQAPFSQGYINTPFYAALYWNQTN